MVKNHEMLFFVINHSDSVNPAVSNDTGISQISQ